MAKKTLARLRKGILLTFLIGLVAGASLLLYLLQTMPAIDNLQSYLPNETTLIFSADGKVLARLHEEENRQVVPLSQISPSVRTLIVASEDPNFYRHHGLDFSGILRASIKNLMYGRVVEGGSTITQQLARNVFLNRHKTIARKLSEALLALQIERRYTKEEILELYLNHVYFGHNSYGIESAANLYYGKRAADLNLAEAALVVGLVSGPELYSPYRNFEGAKQRQLGVLRKALEQNLISEPQAKQATAFALALTPKNMQRLGGMAPYFISHVLQEVIDQFGQDVVYRGGLRVYTTLDSRKQAAAEDVIKRYAADGPKFNFSQAALLSIDPRTGFIEAMVGGIDFGASKYNRAVQSKRQPGSSFKPFVYTAAIEQGIYPGTVLMDTPTTFKVYPNKWNPKGTWSPHNFDRKFHGPVTMRQALERSLNIPSIRLLEQVGIDNAIDVARRMGITSHLEPGLALTLGVSDVSMLEMTSAYGVFANGGVRVEPAAITKIESRDGVTLYKNTIKEKRVIDSNVIAIMVDMMRGVITRGTGVRGQIGRPAAAKTGTTEEFRDAWFIGFVPQLVTGVWVGNDDNRSMRGVAEVAICPRIWHDYNLQALAGEPILDFPRPVGLPPETNPVSEEAQDVGIF